MWGIGVVRLSGMAVAVAIAAAGCQKPTATITFAQASEAELESIDSAILRFEDPAGRMAERTITRNNLRRTLDLLLPGGITRVTIQVDACAGSFLKLTGGASLPVERQMLLPLVPPAAAGTLCHPPDAGIEERRDGAADIGPDVAPDVAPDIAPDMALDATDTRAAYTNFTDSGQDDIALCDDAGVDADHCPDPAATPDGAVTADAGTISAACATYCDDMNRDCPNEYPGVAECQSYCASSGWDTSDPNGIKDSLHCRQLQLAVVPTVPSNAASAYCAAAGPNGGGQIIMCADTVCQAFCDAWVRLCDPGATTTSVECLATCPQVEVSCRVKWLVLAASDRRYCELATIGSRCGGCGVQ
jgi:hypothetical protein